MRQYLTATDIYLSQIFNRRRYLTATSIHNYCSGKNRGALKLPWLFFSSLPLCSLTYQQSVFIISESNLSVFSLSLLSQSSPSVFSLSLLPQFALSCFLLDRSFSTVLYHCRIGLVSGIGSCPVLQHEGIPELIKTAEAVIKKLFPGK